MKTFTILLPGPNASKYQTCVDSQKAVYPEHNIYINTFGCPVVMCEDARYNKDALMCYALSINDSILGMDADICLTGEIAQANNPEMHILCCHHFGIPDLWMIGHNGRKDFFEKALFECFSNGAGEKASLLFMKYLFENRDQITFLSNSDTSFKHKHLSQVK
jgi:hypothetical protein